MNGQSRGVDYFSPANPDAPYFQIKILETIYDIEINYIESFTIDRMPDNAGTFTLTLVNVQDLDLEVKFCELLATTKDQNMSFQYGWNKGPKSKWYTGYIQNYTPTYISGGYIKLDVKGLIVADGEDVVVKTKTYIATSVSDAIQQISEDMGWVIEDLVQTKPFPVPQPFVIGNVEIIDYIREKLEPIALTKKNEPCSFYLDTINGQDHVYFVPSNKGISTQKNYNFFVYMGNYGSVLSWSPQYQGLAISDRVMEAPYFDADTNDIGVYSANEKSKQKPKEGATLTVYGGTSPENMEAILANKWYQENIGNIKGTLEIVGDPTIIPLQKINIIPMKANGVPHLSAGTYLVQHITDTISGDFRTSIEVCQEGADGGSSGMETMPLSEVVQLKQ